MKRETRPLVWRGAAMSNGNKTMLAQPIHSKLAIINTNLISAGISALRWLSSALFPLQQSTCAAVLTEMPRVSHGGRALTEWVLEWVLESGKRCSSTPASPPVPTGRHRAGVHRERRAGGGGQVPGTGMGGCAKRK